MRFLLKKTNAYLTKIRHQPLVVDTITTTSWSTFGKSIGFLVPFFIAAWFGVTAETDVFFFAYGLVLFFIGIFSGAIENVLVPYISEIIAGDKKQLELFVGTISTSCIIGLSFLTVILILIATPVLHVITNFSTPQLHLLFMLLVEISPLLILITLTGILSGVLNAHKIFWLPAISPAFRALVTLSVIYVLKPKIGVHALSVGYISGELVRLVTLVSLILSKNLFPLKLCFCLSPRILQFLKTASYQSLAMVTVGLNPLIDKTMASWLGNGSVTIFEYADRLYAIPFTFLSSGFVVAILSHWSADYYQHKDTEMFKQNIRKAIKAIFPITLIVVLILVFLSQMLVVIIYGHGKFPREKLSELQLVWTCYLLGLAPHMLAQVCAIGLLVLKRTHVLMLVAFGMSVLNVIFNLLLMNIIGLPGITLATSIVQTFCFLVLFSFLFKIT